MLLYECCRISDLETGKSYLVIDNYEENCCAYSILDFKTNEYIKIFQPGDEFICVEKIINKNEKFWKIYFDNNLYYVSKHALPYLKQMNYE